MNVVTNVVVTAVFTIIIIITINTRKCGTYSDVLHLRAPDAIAFST